jgi:hypothetical protein
MGRVFTLLTGTVAAAAVLASSLVSPASAASGPVTQVTISGIYKSVVTCPRWVGPAGGPGPLLAAKSANPAPARGVPQPTYAPIAQCSVVFLKDAPAKKMKARPCARGEFMLSPRHRHARAVCCVRIHRLELMRLIPSCFVLNTGFGGMARQVTHHAPAVARPERAAHRRVIWVVGP